MTFLDSAASSSSTPLALQNYVGGQFVASNTDRRLAVVDSFTGAAVAETPLSTAAEVAQACADAAEAQKAWADVPLKDRVQVFYKLKALLEKNADDLAAICSRENGKLLGESKASLARGIECVEFACCLPNVIGDKHMEVSRGVECREVSVPLGVVAGITPFNFPLMVPLWMWPTAIGLGNAFVLKPSEQTPMSALAVAELASEAGMPDGILNVVNGDREVVEALVDDPNVQAIGFVGSTRVAKAVHARGTAAGKRVRALGGAKNHLVAMPDADPDMTAANVVASFSGCAGQRCMAASVLLTVGDVDHIIDKIREKAAALHAAKEIGGIISEAARDRIVGYLDRAVEDGAKLILDGRRPEIDDDAKKNGYWVGPTIIDHAKPTMECSCDEIFGPTLTIIRCKSLDEALAIENDNPYGNAAAIYTASGGTAEYFEKHASAGMIGINIGVPVPREPFPFGGWNDSSFGDGDLTGAAGPSFWTKKKKITTKWVASGTANWMS